MRIAREIMAQWAASAEATPLSANLIPERDYSSLNEQDEQLRLWLPDPARQALAEICERIDISMTVYLTEFFASYLFGIHEVMRMRDNQIGLYEAKDVNLAMQRNYPARNRSKMSLDRNSTTQYQRWARTSLR